MFTEDTFYVFNIKKNQKYELKRFGEYDSAFDSKFAFLTNGFAFTNFFGNSENDTTSYLNVVEGFNLKRYVIDFVGDVRQLITDDKYIYLLSKKADNSVYIFNIEKKNFILNISKFGVKLKNQKK